MCGKNDNPTANTTVDSGKDTNSIVEKNEDCQSVKDVESFGEAGG
jgi:hypothetical protein